MVIKPNNSVLLAENGELQDQSLLNSAAEMQKDMPVMMGDFNSFKTEMKKSLNELRTSTEESTSLLGINTSIFSIVSLILNVILLIAVVFCFFKISGIRDVYYKLKQNYEAQKEKIDNLSNKLNKLEQKISSMKTLVPTSSFDKPPQPAEIHSFNELSLDKKIVAPPQVLTLEDKCRDFVKEFNALAGQSGYNAKKAADDFMRKYNIQAFNCANHEARMSEPIPAPVFNSVTSVPNGEFWAYEVEAGVYAVVPNVKTYTENHHTRRAMGEVFKSNFVKGSTYNKIRVNKAAIFRGMWNCDKAGELELS